MTQRSTIDSAAVEFPTATRSPGLQSALPSIAAHALPTETDAALWRRDVTAFYENNPRARQRLWTCARRRLTRRIVSLVEPGSRVLEIGCGEGDLLAALKPAYGVGVDLSGRAVAAARRKYPQLRFSRLPGERVHRLADTFDYVVLSLTLDEVYDVLTLWKALHAVCHARTRLIIVQQSRLWQPLTTVGRWLKRLPCNPCRNWLPSDEIVHLLRLADFEPIRLFGMTPVPLGIPLISTLLNRLVGNLPVCHHVGLHYVIVARSLRPSVRPHDDRPSVSVVIPARNEAGHLPGLLERIPRLAERQQVIFVEGQSTDDTWDVLQRTVQAYRGPFDVLCLRQSGTGKADAVRTGFARATGEVLMILDADLGVPPEELGTFYDALRTGRGELINGSRMVYLMDPRAMRFLNLLANKLFGWIFTYLLSQPFRDTLCGTKVLTRRDYQRIAAQRDYFGELDPFGDFELLFGAARLNLRILDVPVHYKARAYGETNISRFRHGWLLLRMCALAARKLKFV